MVDGTTVMALAVRFVSAAVAVVVEVVMFHDAICAHEIEAIKKRKSDNVILNLILITPFPGSHFPRFSLSMNR